MNQQSTAQVKRLVVEIELLASVPKVWEALLNEASLWWTEEFLGIPGSKCIKLEPWAGGRLYEESENGSILWANILSIVPQKGIDFLGWMSPAYGGPCFTMICITLAATENGTKFTLNDSLVGDVSEGTEANLDEGWKMLFGTMFKNYVEGK